MVSAIRAANYLLDKAKEVDAQLTPLQVMKLVYISHGMHLGKYGKPMLSEGVQAWQYGPVIPSLCQAMKRFGRNPVTHRLQSHFWDGSYLDAEVKQTLDCVFKSFQSLSGPALSNLTHRAGSPWSEVWEPGKTNLIIPDEIIRAHYERAIEKGVLESA